MPKILYVYIYIYICIYSKGSSIKYRDINILTCVCLHIYVYTCIRICKHIHLAYIHTHTHAHTLAHMYTYMHSKNDSFLTKAGLYPNYLISSKPKTWCHKLLLNAEFLYCGIREGSVGFLGFGDSDIPQTTVGFLRFSFEVDRAPCVIRGRSW